MLDNNDTCLSFINHIHGFIFSVLLCKWFVSSLVLHKLLFQEEIYFYLVMLKVAIAFNESSA